MGREIGGQFFGSLEGPISYCDVAYTRKAQNFSSQLSCFTCANDEDPAVGEIAEYGLSHLNACATN